MQAFPSEPVKAALRSKPHDPLANLREAIADRLPSPTMAGTAFAVAARMLLVERPGLLAGYPQMVYALMQDELPTIAREVLPDGVGEEVARLLEETWEGTGR